MAKANKQNWERQRHGWRRKTRKLSKADAFIIRNVVVIVRWRHVYKSIWFWVDRVTVAVIIPAVTVFFFLEKGKGIIMLYNTTSGRTDPIISVGAHSWWWSKNDKQKFLKSDARVHVSLRFGKNDIALIWLSIRKRHRKTQF